MWRGMPQKYSDRQLRDLVGNAFPLTTSQCGTTAATFVAAARKQFDDHPHTRNGDVAAALALGGRS